MANITQKRAPHSRQGGVSLIEILVGMLIGMIGIIVIFQVLAVAESQKRNTTGGAEAQAAGVLSLFSLQQDVQNAGYGLGLTGPDVIGCTVNARDATRVGENLDFGLFPVQIIQGGVAPNTHPVADQIRVLYGNSSYFVTQRSFTESSVDRKTMESTGRAGFNVGDLVIFAGTGAAPPCMLAQITCRPGDATSPACISAALPGTAILQLGHEPGGAGKFNDAGVLGAFGAASGFAFNLGPPPNPAAPGPSAHLNVWRITTLADAQGPNRLVVSDTTFQNGPVVELAAGVVDMQAEYGIDQNNNRLVEDNEWTTGPIVGAAWQNLRAIRVAVLSRSEQWDKSASATDASSCSPNPQWTSGAGGALALTNFTMTNLDGAAGSADCTESPPSPLNWRRYRYRVFETVIPLRNMIWGTAP